MNASAVLAVINLKPELASQCQRSPPRGTRRPTASATRRWPAPTARTSSTPAISRMACRARRSPSARWRPLLAEYFSTPGRPRQFNPMYTNNTVVASRDVRRMIALNPGASPADQLVLILPESTDAANKLSPFRLKALDGLDDGVTMVRTVTGAQGSVADPCQARPSTARIVPTRGAVAHDSVVQSYTVVIESRCTDPAGGFSSWCEPTVSYTMAANNVPPPGRWSPPTLS